ncbi:TPA: hypothetical protein H1011_02935 [archaeon]|jgi:hypothetical protein|uniref:Uncharacterized protein n=1 Tax=Candidatus Undinarchaeum marinum TaxID=2756141 RepID=A0A832XG32_9ARCH|nr:hypothetical protein [Candidatus Undinarchaeum marinum]
MVESSSSKKKVKKAEKDPFKEVYVELKKYRKGVPPEESEPSECACS